MDGSKVVEDMFAELQTNVLQVSTWTEVRNVVRAWATQHLFLPCTTTPTVNGLVIAYHDEVEGCQKIQVGLPQVLALGYIAEFKVNKGVW